MLFRSILDREAAIQRAIHSARSGDGVLIAGKGHEEFQLIGTHKQPFCDLDVARTAIMAHPQRAENWPRQPHLMNIRNVGKVNETR